MTSPAPTLNIKIADKSADVTMVFGRLNELAELVGSFERLPEVDFHAPTRTAVLDILLSPRDERGRRIESETVNLHDLTIEDAEAVLDFAKDHLTDFFLGRLEKHLASLKSNGDRLTGVGSSLSGLVPSAS
ncbi:hypothetical protein MKK70_25290 [Methylobacterium sp. E-041]|uniref:hypothetical protein n=1 Tax=Methylobacterium sp. E-041 TaxID=2836573 RepID=UPI001FB8DBBD|nr:hypothetical protein [Methylobacterium sp. E-041]MCJ2108627.1 hypothetical protein [Methylobacterium sp. E-041]